MKFSLSKVAELSETSTRLKEYLGSVSEHNATVNQQSLQAVNPIQDMCSGVTGLAASIRVEQKAASHHRGASMKLLREASWHISGQGHNQTKTSVKELLISSVRLEEKAEKHLGEHTNILKKEMLESSKRQEIWLEKLSKARPEMKASPMTSPVVAKPGWQVQCLRRQELWQVDRPRRQEVAVEAIQPGPLQWHHLLEQDQLIPQGALETSVPMAAGNNRWVAELKVSKPNPPLRQLTVQPVPVLMLATSHPSRGFLNISDMEVLLKYLKLLVTWLPVTQGVSARMNKVVVAPVFVGCSY